MTKIWSFRMLRNSNANVAIKKRVDKKKKMNSENKLGIKKLNMRKQNIYLKSFVVSKTSGFLRGNLSVNGRKCLIRLLFPVRHTGKTIAENCRFVQLKKSIWEWWVYMKIHPKSERISCYQMLKYSPVVTIELSKTKTKTKQKQPKSLQKNTQVFRGVKRLFIYNAKPKFYILTLLR